MEMSAFTRSTVHNLLKVCFRLSVVFAVSMGLYAQALMEIEVSDHRPLAAALEKLQALTGVPINYEDVPYENAADLEDVSTPEQRLQHPGYRLLVPRKGRIQATVDARPQASLSETAGSVHALLASYRAAGLPGDFQVEQANGMIYVTPAKVLNRAGTLQEVQPRMDTVVTIPYAERTAIACVEEITRAVSAATGAKIAVGTFPFLAATKPVACGANREPARNVLAALLSKLADTPASYDLLFEPLTGYMLNLRFLAKSEEHSAAAAPAPAAQNTAPRFFIKQ